MQHNVAFNNMGHAYFLEDGIEVGNVFEGNLGIWTRVSSALLVSDTSPATFWATNPNNTYINNVAAGSEAYGFWFRLNQNPDGRLYYYTHCELWLKEQTCLLADEITAGLPAFSQPDDISVFPDPTTE